MKRLAEFTISLVVAGLIVYTVLSHFDLQRTTESIRQARASLLMIGVGLMVTAYLLRGARWRIWEPSLSYWDSLRLILIGFMGNNVLPFRLGEILRAHCAAAKTSRDRGRTTVLASIAAERILDGMILGVFGLVAVLVVPIDRRLQWGLSLVSLAFVGLILGLILGIRYRERHQSLIRAAASRFAAPVTALAQEKARQFLDGFQALGAGPSMLEAIATSAVVWALETGVCYFIGLAVWDGMTLRTALLVLVVVNFASVLPFTVGGVGTIEAIAPLFLISSGVLPHLALAMVLLLHGGYYLFTTISGVILYFAGGFHQISLVRPKTAVARPPALVAPSSVIEETRRSAMAKLW
jgi:uncharacterized protein (TIRG00374 family)